VITPDRIDELMARSVLRDQRAFAELYRVTSSRLLGVAMRIVRRRDWAEDILQESFVSIWHHVGDFDRSRASPMTWMTTIVRNRALDWVRRPKMEVPDDDLDGIVERWEDDRPGPQQLLETRGSGAALQDCLGQLSGQQRQTIALAYLHGLTHSELAEHMKQPLGTVKTWVRRGLEKLRGCMDAAEAA
jgi:RNA polymerase sigma-70 factor (ECF subfamily)